MRIYAKQVKLPLSYVKIILIFPMTFVNKIIDKNHELK